MAAREVLTSDGHGDYVFKLEPGFPEHLWDIRERKELRVTSRFELKQLKKKGIAIYKN